MTESKEVYTQDEDLCCYICLEVYDNPRQLPCLHSFCHLCLVGYAKSTVNSKGRSCIRCPICRAEMKGSGKVVGDLKEWVDSLPADQRLVSIINSKNSSTEKLCEQCLRDGIENAASVYCFDCSERLCVSCREIHKKVKFLFGHKLYDIRGGLETVAKLDLLKQVMKCAEHTQEEISYICVDHDKLCCNKCAVITHRKCDKLISISEEFDQMENSHHGIRYKLQELNGFLKRLTEYESKYKSTIAMTKGNIKSKLKELKNRFDKAFLAMEETVLFDFEKESDSLLKESAKATKEIDYLRSVVDSSCRKLKIADDFGEPIHMFLLDRILKHEIGDHEDKVKSIHEKLRKRKVINGVEQKICYEIEKKLANCFCITLGPTRSNIPAYPAMCKYTLWRMEEEKEKVLKLEKPEAALNTEGRICDNGEDSLNGNLHGRRVRYSNREGIIMTNLCSHKKNGGNNELSFHGTGQEHFEANFHADGRNCLDASLLRNRNENDESSGDKVNLEHVMEQTHETLVDEDENIWDKSDDDEDVFGNTFDSHASKFDFCLGTGKGRYSRLQKIHMRRRKGFRK